MQVIQDIPFELKEIFQTVSHIKKIEDDDYLFQEGCLANELYLIQNGIIQINKMVPDGRELTFRLCNAGDLIGELNLFCPSSKYLLTAKVIQGGSVAVISKSQLEEKLATNTSLALEYMKWMSLQHRKTQAKFRDLVLHGKKGALYSTIIRLTNSFGIETDGGILINFPLKNQELANFCGTSREVVNRLLSELKKQRVISMEKGLIKVHDLLFLKKEIDCEDCPIEICKVD
ncbi:MULTISPECIES: Crp/Fnr family transcriptional regulator [unclassified Bacillus (in: firmicutes)]|uniref:Crp/Fnr family transcriptional regulator n=1 Tax=unclassified Bacillus (in: firmicutes) TaxID=185979 RepID=UPI0008EA1363|nr:MULTISPECIES: Crp/Fnr family transcriptional regulator [unclassified Bacillus (in: firmicutes)]SFA78905.1 CRP/FNR family transcriptional regulator, anaerobic regulatory protein [Bacillus sp. UNCCL13]SFQ68842.1 CRP/FNR family transcriptional regulator, anaerobic regulatory protein [Bacillus sp. cl95]